jgi:ubiquinone/menaquinone biosynthesis C-methylase UbiE
METKDIMDDNKFVSISEHYDMLMDEDNDPVYDPKPLKEFMDKSDGQYFINSLNLTPMKDVLEIGVGTGRLAMRVAGKCNTFCGIDISEKTVIRARKNLKEFDNVSIILGDFLEYSFEGFYDVIYSSLVFWHIRDKQNAISKIAKLLKKKGTFVLSIDKVQSSVTDYGSRKIINFPDNKEKILKFLENANLCIKHIEDIENAYVIVANKS